MENVVLAWKDLVSANRRVLERIEADLKMANLPTLAWYDALYEIEKAGKAGIRPLQLKDRLLLPQYGTSRLLDRIVKAELIRKAPCSEDGRGFVVQITAKGRTVRREMWPIYSNALAQSFGSLPDQSTLKLLSKICQEISA